MCLDCLIHGHKYEVMDKYKLFVSDGDKMPYGVMYIQKCSKCGKIKKKKIMSE